MQTRSVEGECGGAGGVGVEKLAQCYFRSELWWFSNAFHWVVEVMWEPCFLLKKLSMKWVLTSSTLVNLTHVRLGSTSLNLIPKTHSRHTPTP